jgi:hypothetical protein
MTRAAIPAAAEFLRVIINIVIVLQLVTVGLAATGKGVFAAQLHLASP